jgi:hypothetical protein
VAISQHPRRREKMIRLSFRLRERPKLEIGARIVRRFLRYWTASPILTGISREPGGPVTGAGRDPAASRWPPDTVVQRTETSAPGGLSRYIAAPFGVRHPKPGDSDEVLPPFEPALPREHEA